MPFEIQDEFDDAALWGALDNAPQPRAPPRAPPQPPQPWPQPQSHGHRPQVPHLPHPPGPSWHPQNQNQQPPFPAAGRAALDLRAAGDRRDAYPGVASSSQKSAPGPPGGAPRGGAHPPLDNSNYHRVLGPSSAAAPPPRTDKTVGPSAPSRPRKSVRVELALSPHARRVLVLLPPGFFDPELVRVLKTIPNASFDEVSRRWSFPDANLPDAARALKSARDLAVETVAPSPIAARALQAVVAVEKALARDAERELGLVVSGCGVLPTLETDDFFRGARGATATQRTDLTEACSTEETSPREPPRQERDPGALGSAFLAELHSKRRSTMSPSANEEKKKVDAGGDFSGAEKSPRNAPTTVATQKTSPLSVEDLASIEVDRLYAKIPDLIRDAMFPFQREGVRFALRRGGRCLIGDQMGLGKTVQAIAVAACYREEWPVLILVPTSLRGAWEQALVKWLGLEPLGGAGHGAGRGKKESASAARLSKMRKSRFTVAAVGSGAESRKIDGATFAIVPYSLVGKMATTLLSKRFQVVVCDESHFLKDSKAQRTKAVVPLLKHARRALCLTGTPALSRPVEIFSQAEALRPMVFTKFGEFAARYCSGSRFGWQGSSNAEELHAVLSRLIMIRRLKKDVLTQLPAKSREKIALSLPHSAALTRVRAIRARMDELRDAFLSSEGFSGGGGGRTLEEKRLMNELYQATAEAKTKAVAEYLETLLDSSETTCESTDSDSCEKFLFFGHHASMLDAATEMLRRKKVPHIRIDGSTDTNARQSLVDRFQRDPNARVAVLSIKAAGMGLTLTAASTVIFGELSWTPGDIVQAEDRAHRIGQKNAVNVQFLVAKDTVDDIMWGSVANKLETLGVVLDGVRGDALEMKKCSKTSAPERTREQRLETLVARGDRSPGGRLLDFGAGRETGAWGSGSGSGSGTPKRQGTLDAFVQPKASTAPPPPPQPPPAWLPPPEWDEPDDACLLEVSTLEAKRQRLE